MMDYVTITVLRSEKDAKFSQKQEAGRLPIVVKNQFDY